MPHALEVKYGLTTQELLDAIGQDLRLNVDLDRTAKIHFERKLKALAQEGWIGRYEDGTADAAYDFTIETRGGKLARIGVKIAEEPPTSSTMLLEPEDAKNYSSETKDGIDLTAECMGTVTGNWSQFRYRHVRDVNLWYSRLKDALDAL